jgi:hypothetical protein
LDATTRHEVEIALATTREQVVELHAAQALELIEHAADQVSTERTLAIYCHLHHVEGHEAVVLRTAVLARLGRQPKRLPVSRPDPEDADVIEEWDSPLSLFQWMRRRLQGRSNIELRRWIELHSGRTQTRLLALHVTGALRLVELLKPQKSYAEVVQLYAERMHVPPSLSRAIYFLTLSRLSEPADVPAAMPLPDPVASPERRDEPPLRIAT